MERLEAALRAQIEAARAQNDFKDKLFEILAHDLRGPLGNINALFESSLDPDSGIAGQDVLDLLPDMARSTRSLFDLVENLLEWVRSRLGEISVLRGRVELRGAAEEALETVLPRAKAKGIAISADGPAGASVHSDRRIIETIARNFLSNAVAFSPADSPIALEWGILPGGGAAFVRVSDRGIGMDAADLGRIFSLDSAKKRRGTAGEKGGGIGLALCRDMALSIGAGIEAESERGRGSSFTLLIPEEVEGELEPAD